MHNNCYVMPGMCLRGKGKPVENATEGGRFPVDWKYTSTEDDAV
jgi:hypothetical protein